MLNFMKILPVGVEFFPVDGRRGGQSDRHGEASTGFSQFCERAPKKIKRLSWHVFFFHNQHKHLANIYCCTVMFVSI